MHVLMVTSELDFLQPSLYSCSPWVHKGDLPRLCSVKEKTCRLGNRNLLGPQMKDTVLAFYPQEVGHVPGRSLPSMEAQLLGDSDFIGVKAPLRVKSKLAKRVNQEHRQTDGPSLGRAGPH